MFYVYILKSLRERKAYVGHTDGLDRRLIQHNKGLSIYSRRYAPWRIIYHERFVSREGAVKREKYLKSAVGRRWIKKNLEGLFKN